MPTNKQKSFSQLLEIFKSSMKERAVQQPRLVLITMANTHDALLNKACQKDANSIKKVFANICKHIHFDLCAIEISGQNYHRENLKKAISSIVLHSADDVTVFYYSGHGFSYEKDSKRKYPQIDMRAHDDQPRDSKISFIEKYTENLAVILNILRFKGARINIAIADCCNSTIPFKRPMDSEKEMNVVKGIMAHKNKALPKKLFNDEKYAVSILVSASKQGQYAVSDNKIGSVFTHHFARVLETNISNNMNGSQYIPWLKLLKTTADQAFTDSQSYDIGDGKAGKQNAVFEVFIDKE
ncbi:MAG: caspase family protein [Bacteroidota bacterium]|nr:caspase family protein [Bacteroidota bacterium]